MTDHIYQSLFVLTIETLVRPLEKLVQGLRYTELGAIRYERDVRGITNFLGTQTSYGSGVIREKFTRLQQLGMVLNLDEGEDEEEFWSNAGVSWRISKAEYSAILEQRR